MKIDISEHSLTLAMNALTALSYHATVAANELQAARAACNAQKAPPVESPIEPTTQVHQ